MFSKIKRGIKRFVEDRVKTCEEVLSSAQNRLILGLIVLGAGVGIGGGLILSAYIRVPQ